MGVKFVSTKKNDTVAVVARSVESKEKDELLDDPDGEADEQAAAEAAEAPPEAGEQPESGADAEESATIEPQTDTDPGESDS